MRKHANLFGNTPSGSWGIVQIQPTSNEQLIRISLGKQCEPWQKYDTGSITVKGEFVVSRGESVDNGRVGIRVVDVYPAKYHLLDSPELPQAKMQFFRVLDQSPICEGIFTRGGNRLDLPDVCKTDLEWTVIYIRDINYNEHWVFFDLR
jgi:hypothetical protein